MLTTSILLTLFLLRCAIMADLCKGGGLFSEGISRFDSDIQERVRALSLKQKIGQLTQINIDMIGKMEEGEFHIDRAKLVEAIDEHNVGSFLNTPLSNSNSGGISQLSAKQFQDIIREIQDVSLEYGSKIPTIYGLDSIHGANYIRNATMFPQAINAASSFNRKLTELQGHITAKDTRASGIPWIFAPILGIALQPQWPRVFETFGEDPYVSTELGKAIIMGMQGYPADLSNLTRAAACMKHFIGYSDPRSGHDRSPAWIPGRFLYQYFVPPFQGAVDVGVATAMESYGDINGIPVASSYQNTICLLRDTMKFDGFMVTDWGEIQNLHQHHHIASSSQEAVRLSMEGTSIDMSMVPNDYTFPIILFELASNNSLLIPRIDESVARVIKVKRDLGLFDDAYGFSDVSVIGTLEDKAVSLNLARESIILAENRDSLLPIDPEMYSNILVVGPTGDDIGLQNGGWSIHWQGGESKEFQDGSTIKTGISDILSQYASNWNVTYLQGCDVKGNIKDLDLVLNATMTADLIVVALGEDSYTEVPGDIDDVQLPSGQEDLISEIAQFSNKPIILVLVEGRPRVLRHAPDIANATLVAWLPGPYGGQAIAEIIFGRVNPSARFPITYHSSANTILCGPYWRTHSTMTNSLSFPRWEFGDGLSFSNFNYAPIQLSTNELTSLEEELHITITVTNDGPYDGKEVVLLFIGQEYRIVAPEVKLLRRFKKLDLKKGQSENVTFTIIPKDDLFFYAEGKRKRYEDGNFKVSTTSAETAWFALKTGKYPASPIVENNVQPMIQEKVGVFTSGEAAGYLCLTFVAGLGVMFLVMKYACKFERSAYEAIDIDDYQRQ